MTRKALSMTCNSMQGSGLIGEATYYCSTCSPTFNFTQSMSYSEQTKMYN